MLLNPEEPIKQISLATVQPRMKPVLAQHLGVDQNQEKLEKQEESEGGDVVRPDATVEVIAVVIVVRGAPAANVAVELMMLLGHLADGADPEQLVVQKQVEDVLVFCGSVREGGTCEYRGDDQHPHYMGERDLHNDAVDGDEGVE